jgi:acetolactate synthase-1/2/3 large subunit
MTVSDYIINFLENTGVKTIFMVTGGQAMFLNDAVGRSEKIKPIFVHHEQTAGMSADAYGRLTGKIGVAMVTAGPAAVNVMNGVVGGWVDSAPMMVISGQSALSFVRYQQKHSIRQHGIQGINIKPLVEKTVKYFATIDDPLKVKYYLQKACFLASSGRPGPVWIEVPLDIQGMEVPDKPLKEYIPLEENGKQALVKQVARVVSLLQKSKRPLLLVGQGVRLANAQKEFQQVAGKINCPIITSRLGLDLIESNHPLYVGRPGNYGERAANFCVQHADLIISIGSRMATAMVGHNPADFGREAKIVSVDIDREELDKPGVVINLKINSDAKKFLEEFLRQINTIKTLPSFNKWVQKCQWWKKSYPVVLAAYKKEKPVNSYYFCSRLSELSDAKDMILLDTGSCFHVASQAWKVKKGQRFLTTGGISTMGYWVAGIGACLANNKKRTIIITGDGSLQFNIQEFATIKHNHLPVKVFVFNNNGYCLIKHTQTNFMEGRLMGVSPKTGVWCPDSLKIAKAYGIKGIRISSVKEVDNKIKYALKCPGPVIIDVMVPEWQLLIPRTSSNKTPEGKLVPMPYEDMFPFLNRKEFAKANKV